MRIALVGDIAFTGLLCASVGQNEKRFQKISEILKSADLVFANLEVPIESPGHVNEFKKNGFVHFSHESPTENGLNQLNIGAVSIANNHVYDFKQAGLQKTINLLDRNKIKYTGAGWEQKHIEHIILNKANKKIGFLSYVDKGTNPKTENFQELLINYFDIEKVIDDINNVKQNVDFVIVSIHWGVDYSYYPTKLQVKYAHQLIDSGADIIMGHHPHTIQPFEKYKDGYIFYSLGGLVFGDYYQNGRLIALPRKTKKSIIPVFDETLTLKNIITTKDLKGNYIKVTKFKYNGWSKRKWKIYTLRNKFKTIDRYIKFKESYIDRTYEYFFGYYNHPVKRLFQLKNLKKIRKLSVDYKNRLTKEI